MKKSLLLFCISFLLTGCGTQTIDTTQFIEVKTSGINGKATASAEFDYVALEELILNENSDSDDINNILVLEDSIELSIDTSENLSNGDVITIHVEWDKEAAKDCNISLLGSEKTIEISGLEEATVIDIFDYIDVVYSGISPEVDARIEKISSPFNSPIYYTLSSESNLKNGDIITVTVEADWDSFKEQGLIVENTQKNYTVSVPEEYASQYQQLDENTLNAIDTLAQSNIDYILSDNFTYRTKMYPNDVFWFETVELDEIVNVTQAFSCFALPNVFSDSYWKSDKNVLFIVYEVTCKDTLNPEGKTAYIPVSVSDFIITNDGSITYDENSLVTYNSYDTEDDAKIGLNDSISETYNYELIDF